MNTTDQISYLLKNLRHEEASVKNCLRELLREQQSTDMNPDQIMSLLIEAETLRPKNPGRTIIMEEKDQHNIEIDKIKRSRKECASILSSYESLTERLQNIQDIKSAISGLPQPEQRLFIERYLEGKSVKEIVILMNISPATYWRFHKSGMENLCSVLRNNRTKSQETFARAALHKTRIQKLIVNESV